jgi:cellulose synthase/poly-beta-1,6-N-acetylglucosamine synthase-like glycosyltransferase
MEPLINFWEEFQPVAAAWVQFTWTEVQNIWTILTTLALTEAGVVFAVTVAWLILINGIIVNSTYFLQLVMAYRALRRRGSIPDPLEAWWRLHTQTVPISLIVPAYGEEATIAESVRSLLSLHYPNYEIIVVNDGSKDATLARLLEAFECEPTQRAYEELIDHQDIRGLYNSKKFPRLLVVDKENGGKADALNAGINLSRCPLVCAVDADSILESDALLRAVQPFIESADKVVAVGGTIRVANGCTIRHGRVLDIDLPKDVLSVFQIIEYLRAFLMARLGWSEIGAMMLISGAFGIFKRQILLDVGGYITNTVGEDMEVIVKIHRYLGESENDYEMRFLPEPVCWTEVPRRLRDMASQRKRWERGSLETFFRHRSMFGKRKYGLAGTIGYINILITDVMGPPLEVLGYITMPILYAFGLLNLDFFLAYLALTFVFGVFLSVGSLILEEMELKRYPKAWHLAVLTYAAVLENFGYRQLNNWWRVVGWWEFMRGKSGWGSMTGSGFGAK